MKTICLRTRLGVRDTAKVVTNILGGESDPTLEALLTKYNRIFESDLGQIKHFQAEVKLENESQPVFRKPRTVPFAFRGAVEN